MGHREAGHERDMGYGGDMGHEGHRACGDTGGTWRGHGRQRRYGMWDRTWDMVGDMGGT